MDSERVKAKLNFNSVELIKLVFERPCLWDKSKSEYRNKVARDAAWTEICQVIDDEYNSLTPVMKKHVGTMISRKWFNLRDAYVKSRNNNKRPYVHEKLLTFLDPFLAEKHEPAETETEDEDSCNEDDGSEDAKPVLKKPKLEVHDEGEQKEQEHIKLRLNLSSVKLIKLVRNKPCLWDKSMFIYKDKAARDAAWVEIYRKIDPDYDSLAPVVKKHIGNLISKKWYNIRDAYVKVRNSYKGDRKPYVHTELLKFLNPYIMDKSMDVAEESDGNEEEKDIFNEIYIQEDMPKIENVTTVKEEAISEIGETDLMAVLTKILQREEDEDRAFLKSIVPSIKSLTDESKLEFKINVLKLIKNLKSKDKTGVTLPLDMSADIN